MYCTTCGKDLPDGTSVCDECGTVFSSDVQTSGDETKSEDHHRPYMDYKPFSGAYTDGESDQAPSSENGRIAPEESPYRQNPYAQNAYWKEPYRQEEHMESGRTGFAIAALVLGIIALCSCCLPLLTIPLGILSIVFAVLGMKSINREIGRASCRERVFVHV